MKNNLITLTFFMALLLFVSGCGSKYYFEPKEDEISGKVSYNGSIPSSIASITRDGATLNNGQFITKNAEIPDIKLPKNTNYLNQSDEYYIATNNDFKILLIHKQTQEQREIDLKLNPVAASLDKNLLAFISDSNILAIYDIDTNQFTFKQENTPSPTNNALIASPYFLNDIVILPSLDGKLVIVDKARMQIIRNIVVNGEKYFNNVIFLDAIQTRMVAATPKRIISVSPSVINTFDANIKDILFFEDRIFLFTSEGEVILTDSDLNEIKRKKFPFAHFSAANHGKNIVILETRGYMITFDENLENDKILLLPNDISKPTFSAVNKIFVDNKILDLR